MPAATSSAPSFDLAKARVLIEAVDNAAEPIKKTTESLKKMGEQQKESFPEKMLDTMNKGWLKVAATLGIVATATYGLTRISPVFGSYVEQFFQALGALADTILIPLMPVFEWIVDKMWAFVDSTDAAIKSLGYLYDKIKEFLNLKPPGSTEELKEGELGKGLGSIGGGFLGWRAGAAALTGLGAAGIRLPSWQAKLLSLGAIALGAYAGGETGEKIETGTLIGPNDKAASTGALINAATPGLGGMGGGGVQTLMLVFNMTGLNSEQIIPLVEQKLREALREIGTGTGNT